MSTRTQVDGLVAIRRTQMRNWAKEWRRAVRHMDARSAAICLDIAKTWRNRSHQLITR